VGLGHFSARHYPATAEHEGRQYGRSINTPAVRSTTHSKAHCLNNVPQKGVGEGFLPKTGNSSQGVIQDTST